MKQVLTIILIFFWTLSNAQTTTSNVDLKDVFSFNVKTGYIYTLKVDVSNPNDTTVVIYEPASGTGISVIPQNSNADFKTEIMSGRWTVTTYKIAYFRSIINSFELTDPKVVDFKAQIANLNTYIQDRLALSNRIKQASGVAITDPKSQNTIDSLQTLLSVDFLRMRDSIALACRKVDSLKQVDTAMRFTIDSLKNKLTLAAEDARRDTMVHYTRISMTADYTKHKTIIVASGLNSAIITLPSPVGHTKDFYIKRGSANVALGIPNTTGAVTISCPGFLINGHLSTVSSTLLLAARGVYGHAVHLKAVNGVWELQQ